MRRKPRISGRTLVAVGVVLAWAVVLAISAGGASRVATVQRNDSTLFLPADAEATRVRQLLAGFDGAVAAPAFVVYERKAGITANDRAIVEAQSREMASVRGVISPPAVIASLDGQALEVVLGVDQSDLTGAVETVTELRRVARAGDGLTVHVGGPAGLSADFGAAFKALDVKLLAGTSIVVVLVLLAVYRSPVLWIVPLVSVGAAVLLAQGLVYLAATRFGLPSNGQSQGILTVLLFGAGTDYALLLVSRHREELAMRTSAAHAAAAALRSAAPPIVASGSTVILALLCLTLSTNGANRSVGLTGAIGIASTMAAMLTLLPAILALAGRRVFWPRVPRPGGRASGAGWWGRVAELVGRRSRPALVAGTVFLLVLSGGISQLRADGIAPTDQYRVEVDSTAAQTLIDLHFTSEKSGTRATVVAAASQASAVVEAARAVTGVSAVAAPAISSDGTLARMEVDIAAADGTDAASAAVASLRDAVHRVPGAGALVGGAAATAVDITAASATDFRTIVPLVLAVVMVVLVVLLRSVVAATLLIASVVLSFAASIGVAAVLFRQVLGFAGEDSTFPLTAFVFLIALGIDYNIFLASRMREFARQVDSRRAAIAGLAATGGVISSAGVVLAATFLVFAVLPLVVLAELGITVAVGVLIDTLVVRTLVVPALAVELGATFWWPGRAVRGAGARLAEARDWGS